MPTPIHDVTPAPTASAQDPLRKIAVQLSSPGVDLGMLAALRRFNPVSDGQHNVFEVQRVLLAAGIDLPVSNPVQLHWGLIVHCLAVVRGAHHDQRDTGAQLAGLGLSEARMRQLIEADAGLLHDLLPTLARRLAAAGVTLNWWPLALLLLSQGDADPARGQGARRDLAKGFIRATTTQASV